MAQPVSTGNIITAGEILWCNGWVIFIVCVCVTVCEISTYGLKKNIKTTNPDACTCSTQPKKSNIASTCEASWMSFLKGPLFFHPEGTNILNSIQFYHTSVYLQTIHTVVLPVLLIKSINVLLIHVFCCDLLTSVNILFLSHPLCRQHAATGNMHAVGMCCVIQSCSALQRTFSFQVFLNSFI